MSSLTKFLEQRIQELKSSIESEQAKLAAYENVLAAELASSDNPLPPRPRSNLR
jgi:hypothetical protein